MPIPSDVLASPVEADWSPEGAAYIDFAESVPVESSHASSPMVSESDVPTPDYENMRPPLPSAGGLPGLMRALGWSTGLRKSRWAHGLFGGQTLVVTPMGVHPTSGPVGFSTRTDRLAYGVANLYGDGQQTNQSVAVSLLAFDGADMYSGNPNYA